MQRKKKERTEKAGVGMVALLAALAIVLGFGPYSTPAIGCAERSDIRRLFSGCPAPVRRLWPANMMG